MATISLANQIVAGGPMDPRPINANFSDIVTFINDEVFTTDGSKALSGTLTLGAAATADGHAVQKSQLDAEAATAAAAAAAAVVTASNDATSKADAAEAAAVVTANAYTDSVAVETDFTTDVAAGQLVTTSTPQTFLDTGSFTNTKAGVYIVTASVDVIVNTLTSGQINAFVGELYVDDVAQSNTMVWHPLPPTLGTRMTVSHVWIVSAPAGSTLDFKLKAWQDTGGSGSYLCDGSNHSFLSALFVG